MILSVDCRVCHVCARNFICLLARVCKVIVFWWKPSPLASQVHILSPRSVQSHRPFQHCFQSLFVLVLHAVRNRTKIESGSFPMSLFLWSTIWCSLIILMMSWPAAAAALNSWPSWLWSLFDMGDQIPVIPEKPLAACGYRKFQIDTMGDHLFTCTSHSGTKKTHDWVVDQLVDLFHTTHTVKTQHRN